MGIISIPIYAPICVRWVW